MTHPHDQAPAPLPAEVVAEMISTLHEKNPIAGWWTVAPNAADMLTSLAAERDELTAAIDSIETSNGLTSNGNLWRFWANRASEMAPQIDALRASETALATQLAERDAELARVTEERDAHKMRADNHWETLKTLRSIRVLAREGKLDHIIQHVSDAGAGYTQPDEVTMWELQNGLDEATARIATLTEALTEAKVVIDEVCFDQDQENECCRIQRVVEAALTTDKGAAS